MVELFIHCKGRVSAGLEDVEIDGVFFDGTGEGVCVSVLVYCLPCV